MPSLSSSSALEVERRLLELFKKRPQCTFESHVEAALPDVAMALRVEVINKLCKEKRIHLMRSRGAKGEAGMIGYMMYDNDVADKLKGLDADSIAVYNYVVRQGSKGTWSAEVRKELSYIQQPTITRILHSLAADFGLLKVVHSVNNRTKKVYIEKGIVPSKDLSGGPWYTDGEFDYDFVRELEDYILTQAQKKGVVGVSQMQASINAVVDDTALDFSETQHLLNGLVYTGDLEVVPPAILRLRGLQPAAEEKMYARVTGQDMGQLQHFTSVPCGVCPVMRECREGGIISPSTCTYMDDWIAKQF